MTSEGDVFSSLKPLAVAVWHCIAQSSAETQVGLVCNTEIPEVLPLMTAELQEISQREGPVYRKTFFSCR
jgi:hypothetical protein